MIGNKKFGCRYGQPHDLIQIGDNPQQKWDKCKICGKTFRWNKGYKGRINNAEYLKAHIRQFAQSFGATKETYMKLYEPEKTIIHICLEK